MDNRVSRAQGETSPLPGAALAMRRRQPAAVPNIRKPPRLAVLDRIRPNGLKNVRRRGLDFADADLVFYGRLAPWAAATACRWIIRRGSAGRECHKFQPLNLGGLHFVHSPHL